MLIKGPEKILRLFFAPRVYLLALFCFFVLQGSWCAIVLAKAVPSSLAHEMVNKWLAKEAKPMGSRLGSEVESVKTFTDSNGQPVYYVVVLKPNGFVVVSADDLVEPIVCFSSEGSYDSSARNPLVALVSRDIPARVNASRSVHAKLLAGSSTRDLTKQQARVHKSGEKAFGKWTELLSSSVSGPVSSISDVRVSPLLQTTWGQDVICGNEACYNYYTPPHSAGNANNYYAGCVATAMAQYMRFWQYPTFGVGAQSFTIYVDCEDYRRCNLCDRCEQPATLLGGDGLGGPYDWNQMPLVPNCSTTLAQREAIGDLTYDAGVAVGMDYESDGSGADMSDAAAAMVGTFGYSNAIMGGDETEIDNIGNGLNGMINPNLDWGNPVILGIYNSSNTDGHAVVADGYGYQSSTLYHHLNMGWDGDDDVWYNLPNIDALSIDPSAYSFNVVDNVIYNIYISGTGEIISGRVTAVDSITPVSDANVTAVKIDDGNTYQTTTNTNGIYAFANVPSNSTYTISVASAGHLFTDVNTSTGQSQYGGVTSGNCWAIDFVSLCDVPSAPTGVSASDGNYTDHVQVTWDSVSGATGYEVWRGADSNSSSASKLGDSNVSPFDDNNSITPGTTYYYWVKAKNNCGTSDFSSSDSGYACVIPSVPADVLASDGNYTGHVRVTWDSVSEATNYEVWRNTSDDSGSAFNLGDYTSPYDDYGVTKGKTYYYWVKAKNSCGTSDFSSSDSGYVSTSPSSYSIPITKCTVAVGSKGDSISFSGTMDANADDFNAANSSSDANFVEVIISDENSNDMDPCIITFPVNNKTWKKGKFGYSGTVNGVKKSFSYNVKTGKFAFAASKINLSGLECPVIININVGDFAGTADVNEAIVNGKKPIPIKLLMGVKNSLRVDKPKFTRNQNTSHITQFTVSGGFSVGNLGDANMADNNSVVELAGQTFTIPKGNFKAGKNKFTCSKVKLYDGATLIGIASATFDFNKCTFTLTIKKTNFPAPAGTTNFDISFASFSGSDWVTLPP
ncbi:MAG: C10 family peptidase [Sedimentisphaerales bacterium]|jgi:hypothetical protein